MIYTVCIYEENLEFEWDENKNQINVEKHGVSFEEAMEIFVGVVSHNLAKEIFY